MGYTVTLSPEASEERVRDVHIGKCATDSLKDWLE